MKHKETDQRFASLPIHKPQPVGSSQLSTDNTRGKPRFFEQASIAARNLIQEVLACVKMAQDQTRN